MSSDDLIEHLARSTPLDRATAARVVDEVVAYFAEPLESLVRRRHRELQREGHANAEIYAQIAAELAERPIAAPELSERQIRRLVYG